MREARLIIVLMVAFFLASFESFADDAKSTKEEGQTFGAYNEKTLDLEVKVENGSIKVWRTWNGETGEWEINPQQGKLEESEEKEADQYGNLFAQELHRGLRKFKSNGGGGVYSLAPGAKVTGGDAPDSFGANVAGMLDGVTYCTNANELSTEEIIQNAAGHKWISTINRSWAQYSQQGLLESWGIGSHLIGQILYGASSSTPTGYKDANGFQVISYGYDSQGRITRVSDYAGREVNYTYNNDGQLVEVVDAAGVRTRYEYRNNQIIKKTEGDSAGIPADAASSNESSEEFTYSGKQLVKSKDGGGFVTTFQYEHDSEKKVFTRTRKLPGNKVLQITTDENGKLKSYYVNGKPQLRLIYLCEDTAIIDRHNRVTYFDRDGVGRLKKIIYPDKAWTAFEHTTLNWPEKDKPFDQQGMPWGIKSMTTSSGRKVDYLRNKDGEILQATETLPGGELRVWKFDYNLKGQKIKERLRVGATDDDANDWIKHWDYDQFGNVKEFKDAQGNTWLFEYNSQGLVTKVTDPYGSVSEYSYNANGEITRIKSPLGRQEDFIYNRRGLLNFYSDTYESSKTSMVEFRYDRRGQLTKFLENFDDTWTFAYDDAGNLILTRDPEGREVRNEYDEENRVTSEIYPNGYKVGFKYFDTGLAGEPEQTEIAFPPLTYVEYPTFTVEVHRDLRGRPVKQVLRADSEATQVISYEYDNDGHLVKLTRPDGKSQSYTYDDLSRVTSVTTPGWGTSSVQYLDSQRKIIYKDPLGKSIEQSFTQLGQLFYEKRADGTGVRFYYDNLSNLIGYLASTGMYHRYYPDAEGQITKEEIYSSYPPTGPPLETATYSYNLRGDLTGYTGPNGGTTYSYDALGQLTGQSTNFGSFSKTHRYTYTPSGLLDSYRTPENTLYKFTYDTAAQLLSMDLPGEGAINYTYGNQSLGEPESVILPGGVTKKYEYDKFRRLKRLLSLDTASNVLFDQKYEYDPVTSQLSAVERGSYLLDPDSERTEYSYDEGYRLSSEEKGDDAPKLWSYDLLGNRTSAEGQAATFDANGGVQSQGTATFQYNADGNRTEKKASGVTTKYLYDNRERLSQVERPAGTAVAKFGYDPTGQRKWKEVSGVRTYYDYTPDGLAGEYDSQGNLIRSYFYEGGSWQTEPLFQKTPEGYYYYHNDRLGTPQKLTNHYGSLVWEGSYDPWGKATVSPFSTVENPHRFPGQYYDPEVSLNYNLMRDYDPEVGSYLEQDPMGILAGPNRYGYALGDPVQFIDPRGEIVPLILGAVWLGAEAYTGFPTFVCLKAILEFECLEPDEFEACVQVGVSAALGWGIGKLVGIGIDLAAPFMKPLIKKFGPAIMARLEGRLGRIGQLLKLGKRTNVKPRVRHVPGDYSNWGGELLDDFAGRLESAPSIKPPNLRGLPPPTRFGSKIDKQLSKRGWTPQLVEDAIDRPTRTMPTRDTRYLIAGDRMDDPATAYFSRRGGYVVRNDRTGEIVQISNRLDANWRDPW